MLACSLFCTSNLLPYDSVCTRTCFETEVKGKSEMAYSIILLLILKVIGLLLAEVTRSVLLSMAFFTNVRTGARIRAMILTMVYNKVSKLRNVGDKSIGEVHSL